MFTDFGFQKVEEKLKSTLVQGVFSKVATKYDVMNDIMSGGLHRLWKRDFVGMLPIHDHDHILDIAGGTGDIAFKIIGEHGYLNPHVTVCDLTPDMVQVGQKRAIDRGYVHPLSWSVGNAESLPFQDNSFDGITISFGLRNCTHIDKVISESYRVLKPGGFFYCLEFSKPILNTLEKIYDIYSFYCIPKMGKIVAGDEASYQYLIESIRRFPDQESLCQMLISGGFDQTSFKNLSGGIVAIHHGFKPQA
ncbi:MAG: class I SAM-dependent methyltransferase [Alphaproteobacteria bacterium]|nr:class I SAM-dependent methyltransferase [Alphaproteobacteria bacterium]